jgi:acetyl-CoA synthetase
MDWPLIRKARTSLTPNLCDYDAEQRAFSWENARQALSGLPGDRGLNIAYEAVGRHAAASYGEKIALRWLAKEGAPRDFSYRQLDAQSNRLANAFAALGVGPGDRVFTLLGRIPELYLTALAVWKRRAVFAPLFSVFGQEPVRARMAIAEPKALVTTAQLFKRKVEPILDQLPFLKHVILVGGGAGGEDFNALVESGESDYRIPDTDPEDLAIIHFTSGTTGKPKGAMHAHAAVIAHQATARYALDLREDDIYWCTADPGWVTGTSYGIIAPLVIGCTLISDEQEFDARRWYGSLQNEGVTVWYTAPTAIRMLMKAGEELPGQFDLSRLRFVASVGEPLNPEAVLWGKRALGLPIHDNWWQTETGGVMIANYAGMDIKPGSMGRPLPGVEAAIMRPVDGHAEPAAEPDVEGELALKPGWPSMFRGYLHEEERYAKCFRDGWYMTGDIAKRDEDGYFWFVCRNDDAIKSAGHLIGPFEVESALIEHPAVAEAGVIGVPDAIASEVVKAFVALKPGYEPSEELRKELLAHARRRLGPAVAPREIDFRVSLPKTRSGKIMRRLLKAQELGLPEGDVSTLENDEAKA